MARTGPSVFCLFYHGNKEERERGAGLRSGSGSGKLSLPGRGGPFCKGRVSPAGLCEPEELCYVLIVISIDYKNTASHNKIASAPW